MNANERNQHVYKILTEDIPSCGCGWPEGQHRLYVDLLRLQGSRDHNRALEFLHGDVAVRQALLSVLDHAGLIRHSMEITYGRLTPKGSFLLHAVDTMGEMWQDELEYVGLPPYDHECTDECWVVDDTPE